MEGRALVILKEEVHSLVLYILLSPSLFLSLSLSLSFHASRSVGSGRSFCREHLPDVDINFTPVSTAVVQITLKCKSNPHYVSTVLGLTKQ